MHDATAVIVENGGTVCLPDEILSRHGWTTGAVFVAISSDLGLFLADRVATEHIVGEQLSEHDLPGELVADRRHEAELDSV